VRVIIFRCHLIGKVADQHDRAWRRITVSAENQGKQKREDFLMSMDVLRPTLLGTDDINDDQYRANVGHSQIGLPWQISTSEHSTTLTP
jgi:hypothetical protein